MIIRVVHNKPHTAQPDGKTPKYLKVIPLLYAGDAVSRADLLGHLCPAHVCRINAARLPGAFCSKNVVMERVGGKKVLIAQSRNETRRLSVSQPINYT